jgi:chlorite dismutase
MLKILIYWSKSKKNTDALIVFSIEVSLEVNAEETKFVFAYPINRTQDKIAT